jgi:hypothetical protein
MFFRRVKPGYFWDCTLPANALVFTGWLQLPGQPKMDFRGAAIPSTSTPDEVAGNILQAEDNERRAKSVKQSKPSQGRPTQNYEEQQSILAKKVEEEKQRQEEERDLFLLGSYGEQLKQLYGMGFQDVKLILHLLDSCQGDVAKVVENLSA